MSKVLSTLGSVAASQSVCSRRFDCMYYINIINYVQNITTCTVNTKYFSLSQTLSGLSTSREYLVIKNSTTSGSNSLFFAAKCKIVLSSYKIIYIRQIM